MKKNSIAKKMHSLREGVLSSFRSPNTGKAVNGNGPARVSPKVRVTKEFDEPDGHAQRSSSSSDESLPAVSDNLARELKEKVLKINCALRFFQGAAEKGKFELLPGSSSIVLDSVSSTIMTLKNAIPAGDQSSVLISASASVYNALANIIKWSDDVLLEATATGSYENIVPKEDVQMLIENFKTALQELVQIVIEKASTKGSETSSESSVTPNRLSKASNDSALDDSRSYVCSTDSLSEDCNNGPPPKPPLPGRTLVLHSEEFGSHDPSPPPPLPPKRKLHNSFGNNGLIPSLFNSTDSNLSALPDLVSHEAFLTAGMNSMSISSASHEVFRKEIASSFAEQRQCNITMGSSTSSFSSSSFSSFSSSFQSFSGAGFFDENTLAQAVPPALPLKRRQKTANRTPSQYDNVDCVDGFGAETIALKEEQTSSSQFHMSEEKHSTASSTVMTSSSSTVQMRRVTSSRMEHSQFVSSFTAPPLPLKKRHIMAYMEMVGPYSQPLPIETYRQSVDMYNAQASEWQTKSENLFLARASSYIPPPPPALPSKKRQPIAALPASEAPPVAPATSSTDTGSESDVSLDGMEQLELSDELVEHKTDGESSEVCAGTVNALIIHATKGNRTDFLYQEAFLATYRTFISTQDLVSKLVKRFHYFLRKVDAVHQRAAKNSFSFLVRIVDDLTLSEIDSALLGQIMEFQNALVSSGDLVLARALRSKLLEKCTTLKKRPDTSQLLPSLNVTMKANILLDFKSSELAEQMTLLDCELFYKIEVPEVLIWAQEQNEEKTTNLNLFTEHFNKVSYWVRSRILEQGDAKERERYVVKFIKIMKHLRRLNNFNSYLALLSALDSAPVRRLEWHKSITDGLEEYCALIDSSSSFRAYRQALAETEPPCIPYIGLILQDLTFVHIGNPDLLADGKINFSKRWLQFHILANMRRFQKCQYQLIRNEKIINFFNDFNDFMSEEAMWSISESIKPRGSANNSAAKK